MTTAGPSLRWLFIQVAMLHAAFSVVRPMVSYRALELDAGSAQIGLLAASFAVLPLLLAFVAGRRADRVGPVRLLVIGSALIAVGSVVALLVPSFLLLLLASALLGFAYLLVMLGSQSVVAANPSVTVRDRGFGWLTGAASLGQMLGPAVAFSAAGHLAGAGGSVGVVGLAIAAGVAALAVPLAFGRRRAFAAVEHERTTSRQALGTLLRTDGMWRALVTSGTVLAGLDILLAFLPAWAEERGVSVAAVGWLLTLRAFVSLLSRVTVARLIAVLSRRWTFVGSMVAGVAGLAVLPFVDVPGAVGAMVLLGVGLGLAQPLTLSWVSTLSAPGMRGAALGLRLTGNRLAQTVLPPAIALAAAGSGSGGVFLGSALVLAVATTTVLPKRVLE